MTFTPNWKGLKYKSKEEALAQIPSLEDIKPPKKKRRRPKKKLIGEEK